MRKNNIILTICIMALAVMCFMSVNAPIKFEKELNKREVVVKARLIKIRIAEEKYRNINGSYCSDWDILTKGKFIADSLKYIPFSNGKIFKIATSVEISKSGRSIPTMECSAEYKDYMNGMDENGIAERTDKAIQTGLWPGLKIGDLTTPNNNAGNWE